ncbi:hypothetical protein MAR_018705, partial [Mya arenaria]
MLCSDCARVHRNSKMSINHVIILGHKSEKAKQRRRKITPGQHIPVKSSDYSNCCISGMILLSDDILLLTDWNNNKVKFVDLQRLLVVSQIDLPGQPWDICQVTADVVAVTIPFKGIQLLKVERRKEIAPFETKNEQLLELESNFPLDEDCRGVDYFDGQFIVSFYRGKVANINVDGSVTRQIQKDDFGQQYFECPLRLRKILSNQSAAFLVSDNKKNTVTMLDIDLNILKMFYHNTLQSPTGMEV